ncbi:hypothetical protein SAMN05216203_3127 [Marinobacter daqiaonensis]|uniref:WGR domain-containing protein n=1 Tax=Marinobacter daqiaonensis TaxID=650891 RepID=A0A1I6JPJ5_9GAMM|nr:hypothetical protein [Marinobacter daqiaonensis]SFR80912.1 hypothetical protein SAMN05216203_3127 [Marinobacter daqiaonensis]
MKLHYFHGRSPLRSLVLTLDHRRVELHVKKVDSDVWSLVAMIGSEQGHPDTSRCQGPYRSQEKAEAALRSATGSLLEKGYEPRRDMTPQWSVCAQRMARDIREQGKANSGQYVFDSGLFEPSS